MTEEVDKAVEQVFVKGRFKEHTCDKGFVYEYTCPECGKDFVSVAPGLSAPTICHRCYTGEKEMIEIDLYKHRKAYRKRKAQHLSQTEVDAK
jgi:hypothetical protein